MKITCTTKPFVALQVEANSMCVAGAEEYYRKMFFRSGRDTTW